MWYEAGLVSISSAVFFYSSYEFGKVSAKYSLRKSLKDLEDTKNNLSTQNKLIDDSILEHKKLLNEISMFFFF